MTKSSRSSALRTFFRTSFLYTLVGSASLLVFATGNIAAAASSAKVVVENAAIKLKPALLGSQTVKNVPVGTELKVLSTKGTFSEVEVVGDTATKGWILTAQITTDASVMKAIGKAAPGSGVAASKLAVANVVKGLDKTSAASAAKGLSTDSSESDETETASGGSPEIEKIDSSAVSEADLMAFMKEGGLKSRLIK